MQKVTDIKQTPTLSDDIVTRYPKKKILHDILFPCNNDIKKKRKRHILFLPTHNNGIKNVLFHHLTNGEKVSLFHSFFRTMNKTSSSSSSSSLLGLYEPAHLRRANNERGAGNKRMEKKAQE
ncbi:hypothetical protein NPIL_72741 [Nephila pilipes]|uniref:Uncharacterized protein n=1 Tax=Nephila pilipes TaxID=299642 RepID=A0A8X6IWA1_NEPPI|nr:hypothetical protein NPIL_72741 [Nephila pilipes]